MCVRVRVRVRVRVFVEIVKIAVFGCYLYL